MQVVLDIPKLVGVVLVSAAAVAYALHASANKSNTLKVVMQSRDSLALVVKAQVAHEAKLTLALNAANNSLKERARAIVALRDTARASTDSQLVILAESIEVCEDSTGKIGQAFFNLNVDLVAERSLSDSALGLANRRADTIKVLSDSVGSLHAKYVTDLAGYSNLLHQTIRAARPSRWGLGVVAGADQQGRANIVGGVVWSILSPNVPWGIGAGAGVGLDLKPAIGVGVTFHALRFAT